MKEFIQQQQHQNKETMTIQINFFLFLTKNIGKLSK